MPTNSFIFPASGNGFDRAASLASFASGVSGVSGMGFLVNGSYEIGDIYTTDGFNLNPAFISSMSHSGPFTTPTPTPNVFGDWVYYVLGGQLPTMQATGGIEFAGGAYGNINWANTAFTGTHSLQVQTQFGGTLGFDSAITSLNLLLSGAEIFAIEYQITDILPQEILVQFYDAVSQQYHGVYIRIANPFGPAPTNELFGVGGHYAGVIPASIGTWQTIVVSAAQLGLTTGSRITGMSWGVWNQTTTSTVLFSDTGNTNIIVPSGSLVPSGYIACDQDGGNGYYALSHFGPLVHVAAVGAPSNLIQLPNTPSFDYTGLVFNTVDGNPWFIGSDGSLYNYSGGFVLLKSTPAGGGSVPARWLESDGNNHLWTMFPTTKSVGQFSVSGGTWAVTGTPFTATLDTISYSKSVSGLITAGTNNQDLNITSLINDIAISINTNQLLIAEGTTANTVAIYNWTTGGWSFSHNVSGYSGIPTRLITEPDGLQALVLDPNNSQIEVLTDTGGVWSQTSTVTGINNPNSIAIVTSGVTQALVSQPANSRIAILNKSSLVWSLSQVVTGLSSPSSIAVAASGTSVNGIIATSTGVTFLAYNGAVWTATASLAVTPAPSTVTADLVANNGIFYGAATSGGNTKVYIFQNQSLVGQYTITGDTLPTLGDIKAIDWEIIVPSAGTDVNIGYYVGGLTNNTLSAALSPSGAYRMAYASTITDYLPVLLMANQHDIWSFYNSKPQQYTRVTDSQVAIITGSSWQTIDVNNRNRVSSITTDPSGNIFAVTTDNYLYKWNSAGTLASGYPFIVVPPAGQQTSVPLGLSKLVWWRNAVWSSASLMGGIVTIIP